jgi:hypothetical protein
LANAMRFVPMDYCTIGVAVFQANGRPTFEFAPIAGALLLAQARQVVNALAFGDDFNIGYLADDLEIHGRFCPASPLKLIITYEVSHGRRRWGWRAC